VRVAFEGAHIDSWIAGAADPEKVAGKLDSKRRAG